MPAGHGAATAVLGMWVAMMLAMMLPAVLPTLWRYCQAAGSTSLLHRGGMTALAGTGYLVVWSMFAMASFPLGIALAHTMPAVGGGVVVVASALQFTAWKAHHLACCRELPRRGRRHADAGTALRYGVRLALHCGRCCANLMAILLFVGAMDPRVMTVVTAAIAAERVAPAGERAARAIGILGVGAGLFLLARAAGLG